MVVESCPTPRWITFLMLYRLVYNIRSHFNYLNLARSAYSMVKASGMYKSLDYWSRDTLNFDFSKKGLGLLSPPHFVHGFSRKLFPMLHSIKILLTDQISLSDCLYFTRYWAICVLLLFVNQAVTSKNLKLTLLFWSSRFDTWPKSQDKSFIKTFWYMAIKSRQKLKYSENRESFWGEIKNIFHHF